MGSVQDGLGLVDYVAADLADVAEGGYFVLDAVFPEVRSAEFFAQHYCGSTNQGSASERDKAMKITKKSLSTRSNVNIVTFLILKISISINNKVSPVISMNEMTQSTLLANH